jgi:hypothetical protein
METLEAYLRERGQDTSQINIITPETLSDALDTPAATPESTSP